MTWYVDAAAPCPGDGSAAAPFCMIQPAIDGAFDGIEPVDLVVDGTDGERLAGAETVGHWNL